MTPRTLCAYHAAQQQNDFEEDHDAIISDSDCQICEELQGRDWADRDFSEPYEP